MIRLAKEVVFTIVAVAFFIGMAVGITLHSSGILTLLIPTGLVIYAVRSFHRRPRRY